jgi:hypothetical protein
LIIIIRLPVLHQPRLSSISSASFATEVCQQKQHKSAHGPVNGRHPRQPVARQRPTRIAT